MIGEHFTGARDVGEHSIEHAAAMPIVIHTEFKEVAQKTASLRDAEGNRMPGSGQTTPSAICDY